MVINLTFFHFWDPDLDHSARIEQIFVALEKEIF